MLGSSSISLSQSFQLAVVVHRLTLPPPQVVPQPHSPPLWEVTSAEFDAYLLELGSWSKCCLGGRERVEQHRESIGREEERER